MVREGKIWKYVKFQFYIAMGNFFLLLHILSIWMEWVCSLSHHMWSLVEFFLYLTSLKYACVLMTKALSIPLIPEPARKLPTFISWQACKTTVYRSVAAQHPSALDHTRKLINFGWAPWPQRHDFQGCCVQYQLQREPRSVETQNTFLPWVLQERSGSLTKVSLFGDASQILPPILSI